MVKGCPKNKTKAKGACRTKNQKAGDRHRKLVLSGKAKPYSEHKNRRKPSTKKSSGRRKGGIEHWCADARKTVKLKNGKMTVCEMLENRRDKMLNLWEARKGTTKPALVGPALPSRAGVPALSAFMTPNYNGLPSDAPKVLTGNESNVPDK